MSNKSDNRSFDWGPPPAAGESWQDWGIYILLLFLLAGGGMILFSDNHDPTPPASRPLTIANHADPALTPHTRNHRDLPAATGIGATPPASPTPMVGPVGDDDVASVAVTAARYEVQLGAFGDEASARETMAAVAAKFKLQTVMLPPGTPEDLYRVVAGPFATETEAERLALRLNAADFPCFVVESP